MQDIKINATVVRARAEHAHAFVDEDRRYLSIVVIEMLETDPRVT